MQSKLKRKIEGRAKRIEFLKSKLLLCSKHTDNVSNKQLKTFVQQTADIVRMIEEEFDNLLEDCLLQVSYEYEHQIEKQKEELNQVVNQIRHETIEKYMEIHSMVAVETNGLIH